MAESKQLKNCDHLQFWSKYYLLHTFLKYIMPEQKSGIVVEGFWGGVISEITSCAIYSLRLGRELHSLVILMWCLSPVSNTYGGWGEERDRGLNLANVDRSVLKLVQLLHGVNEGKTKPCLSVIPQRLQFL